MPTLEETLRQFQENLHLPVADQQPDTLAGALQALRASGASVPGAPDSLEGQSVMLGTPARSPVARAGGYVETNLQNPASDSPDYGPMGAPPQPALPPGIADTVNPFAGQPGAFRFGDDRPVTISDRKLAEHGDPDVSDTAGFDPYSVPNPTTPAGADQAVNDQAARTGRAYMDAQAAKTEAEKEHATATAQAYEDSAEETLLINNQYDKARAAGRAKADGETAAWLTQMDDLAKKEPLPGRWWNNESLLGKALWGLGLAFSSASAALTPGSRNAILDMVRENIQQDMAQQEKALTHQYNAAKVRGEMLRDRQARDASDLQDKHSRALSRVAALERAWVARAAVPGDKDAEAQKMAANLFIEQQLKLPIVEQKRQTLYAAHEAQLSRAHADALQRSAQAHAERLQTIQQDAENKRNQARIDQQMYEANLNDKRARDLSPVDFSVGRAGTKGQGLDANGMPSVRIPASGVGAPSGLVMMGPDGKPLEAVDTAGRPIGKGALPVRTDEQLKNIGETNQKANVRYAELKRLADLLDEGAVKGIDNVFTGVRNPEVEAQLTKIGYANAKEYDSRITDADFQNGINQAVGFSPDGKVLDKLKFNQSYDQVRKLVHQQLDDMPRYVSNQIDTMYDQSLVPQGSHAVWDPRNLRAPEVPEQNAGDIKGTRPPPKPVKNVSDYEQRLSKESTDIGERGYLLPKHDPAAVREVIDGAQNRAPSTIHAKATQILDQLDAQVQDLEKQLNPPASATDLWNGGKPLDEGTKKQLFDTLDRVRNTQDLVKMAEDDEVKQQQKKLDNFRKHAQTLVNLYGASDDNLRNVAKGGAYKLTDAKEEVDQIIREVQKNKTSVPKPMFLPNFRPRGN